MTMAMLAPGVAAYEHLDRLPPLFPRPPDNSRIGGPLPAERRAELRVVDDG